MVASPHVHIQPSTHGFEGSLPNMHLSVNSLTLSGSYKQRVYLGKSVWDPLPDKEKSKWQEAAVHSARQYCFTGVLHGVKYFAEPRRPHLERFSWSLVLLSLVAAALYLVWVTSLSDLSKPLLINLESSNHPIWNFNFPAVTLCPSKKLSRPASEAWARKMILPQNMSHSDLVDLLPSILHLIDFTDSPETQQLHHVLEMNKVNAHELYLNLSVQCKDLLVQCRLHGVSIPCQNLFKTIRTTEGYCCSFNYFGVSSKFYLNRYHQPSDVTPKVPLRVSSNGQNSGISVLMRSKDDTFGTMMSSQGVKVCDAHTSRDPVAEFAALFLFRKSRWNEWVFSFEGDVPDKVLLHVATNFPDHLAIERFAQPEHSEHFALYPTMIGAGPEIREVALETRNCYFFDEKPLDGFQDYSYKSCIFNCRIQFFVDLCGCIPFYYPSHADGIRTCSLKDVPCLTQFKCEFYILLENCWSGRLWLDTIKTCEHAAIDQIQALRVNLSLVLNHTETAPCGCRPQCNELSYGVATSTYTLSEELKTYKYGSISTVENYSEVNVYFKALFGTKYQRVQHSTTFQMLANFGGLLGLFMGFSFIAAFEVIYSFTLRIFFRVYLTSKGRAAHGDNTQVLPYE